MIESKGSAIGGTRIERKHQQCTLHKAPKRHLPLRTVPSIRWFVTAYSRFAQSCSYNEPVLHALRNLCTMQRLTTVAGYDLQCKGLMSTPLRVFMEFTSPNTGGRAGIPCPREPRKPLFPVGPATAASQARESQLILRQEDRALSAPRGRRSFPWSRR